MEVYNTQYYGYPGGSYINEHNVYVANGQEIPFIHSTARSSESSSSRHSRLLGLDGDRRISHDSKPRLSKDQQEILEAHFQRQNKPSTSVKRDYSEKLGIPLEKINNWFQNRRAKVKQEAKKSQSQPQPGHVLHYTPQMAQGLFQPETPYNDNSYYQQTEQTLAHTVATAGGLNIQLPGDANEPLVNGVVDNFGSAYDAGQTAFASAMVEPTFEDSHEAFNSFFGLDDAYQPYPSLDHHALVDFGKQFNPRTDILDSFPHPAKSLNTFHASTSVSDLTQSSRDEGSLYLNMSHDEQAPTMASRANSNGPATVNGSTTAHIGLVPQEQVKQERKEGVGSKSEQEATTIPHHFFAQEEYTDLPLRPASKLPREVAKQSRKSSKPSASATSSTPQASVAPKSGNEQTMTEHARTDDIDMSNSMDIIKPGALAESLVLKPPTAGLAARRRHRPATLASGSMRSASFTNMASPTSPIRPAAPEPHLRRIKSSGVINGRIQKSGTGSGQRSPVGPVFPDGTVSPKIARQLSLQSIDAVAADHANTPHSSVPMTPLSPMDTLQSPPHSTHHQPGRPYSTIIESDMEHLTGIEAQVPTANSVMPAPTWTQAPPLQGVSTYVSPPRTPMEFGPHSSFIPQTNMGFSPHQMPPMPQSAPAWQQAFPHQLPPSQSPYVISYGQAQPGIAPQGVPVFPMMQNSPLTAAPHSFGHQVPRNVVSSEDPTVAAMLAAQHQLFVRRPSGPGLSSAQSMPAMNNIVQQQQQQQQQQQHFVHHPNVHAVPMTPQAIPQGFLYDQRQPPSLIYPPVNYQQHQQNFDASFAHPYDGHATSPIGPYHTTARSNSVVSMPMSMSMSPTPGPLSAGGHMLGSPTSGISMNGSMLFANTPIKSPTSPELFIHEYSPREPADPSRLPPKNRITTPRTFSFQHTGPEAFSASP